MVTGKIILSLLALLVTVRCDCDVAGKTHKTGETWTQERIIFECLHNGRKPIACITHSHRMNPGTKWNSEHKPDGGFVYECVDTGNLTMALNIIACIAPDGKEFKIGEKVTIDGATHTCDKTNDNEITQSFSKGCDNNGKIVQIDDLVEVGTMKKICVYRANNFTFEAYSCVFPDEQEIRVGTYAMINKDFYKCSVDLIDLTKPVQEKINVTSCGPHSGEDRHLLDEWKEGNATYRCLYNMTTSKIFTVITKCHYKDTELESGETHKGKNGHYYYCNPDFGFQELKESQTYCNLPDGSKFFVTESKDLDNVRYNCLFNGQKAAYSVEGCIYTGGEVIAYGNHTELSHGSAYRCSQINGKFKMVKMTAQEYKLAYEMEQGSISGHGGEGSGYLGTDATDVTESATEPSTQNPVGSTHEEEPSTVQEDHSTPNEEHSTPNEEHSTPKDETSTHNEEPSTVLIDKHSTPKDEVSTPAEESSTNHEEPSTHHQEPSTNGEVQSTENISLLTHTQEAPTEENTEPPHKPTKPHDEFDYDKSTVRPNIDETVAPHCPDLHHMCEKFGHICNPDKFKDHHKNLHHSHHSSFRRGSHSKHSSHDSDSDESCDWSEEVESKEEHCTDCKKKLKHMKKAHIKLIKMMCPQTCGCGCFGGD